MKNKIDKKPFIDDLSIAICPYHGGDDETLVLDNDNEFFCLKCMRSGFLEKGDVPMNIYRPNKITLYGMDIISNVRDVDNDNLKDTAWIVNGMYPTFRNYVQKIELFGVEPPSYVLTLTKGTDDRDPDLHAHICDNFELLTLKLCMMHSGIRVKNYLSELYDYEAKPKKIEDLED